MFFNYYIYTLSPPLASTYTLPSAWPRADMSEFSVPVIAGAARSLLRRRGGGKMMSHEGVVLSW
jgi:hypothetical protein